MVDRIHTAYPVSPVALAGLDRALAVAGVLLSDDSPDGSGARLPSGPERDELAAGVDECRQLVGELARLLGLSLPSREVGRFFRRDVSEAIEALASLRPQGRALPVLEVWREHMGGLLDDVEALANQRPLPGPNRDRQSAGGGPVLVLTESQRAPVEVALQVIRQYLVSAVAWLDTAAAGATVALTCDYRPEELRLLRRLCLQAQEEAERLSRGAGLELGRSPWALVVAARLLEAYNAGNTVFQTAYASGLAGERGASDAVPITAALLTRLKTLQRDSA